MTKKELIVCLGIVFILFCCTYSYNQNAKNNYSGTILEQRISDVCDYIAVKTEKSGGATTPFCYHLIILNDDEKLTNKSEPVLSTYDDFEFYWSDSDLIVVITGTKEVFTQKYKYKDVNIKYLFSSETTK